MHSPRSREVPALSRRLFLQGGILGGVGLSALPGRVLAARPPFAPKAQAVIQVHLAGGLSHIDSFDPKPMAPVEYRGEFAAIKSKLDGERLSEVLAHTAKIADRLTLIRSFSHGEAAHERGTHNMLTAYRPSPVTIYPSIGAVVSHQLGNRNNLPAYVCIPNDGGAFGFLGTGYLSAAYAPFSLGGEPNSKSYRVRDMTLPKGVGAARLRRRRALVDVIDEGFEGRGQADAIEASHSFYEQAYALIDSPEARDAFEIKKESDEVRDRYGRTDIGQRLLLARRLAQAGARYLVVTDGGYDNHRSIFPSLRSRLQSFDVGFAALISDLEERGLLDSTLVVVTSEFGRTPKVNRNAGRDHWPRAFTVVMAGAGVKRGYVCGATNANGSGPDTDPVGPPDLGATIYDQLGIDPNGRLLMPGGRPAFLVRDGRVLRECLA